MFQALKKLILAALFLAAPAVAQWGAVTAVSDSNRFIASTTTVGLIMPHQQIVKGRLDTIITSALKGGGNASKVIVGSLLDHEDNCVNYTITNGVATCQGSYERWREMEKSTSWYQADRGDTTAMFPTNYAITVSTGNDSVKIWNRDTAESWMVFNAVANNMLYSTAVSDIAFLDGILYVGSTSSNGLADIDFLIDKGQFRHSSNSYNNKGNIQQRNDGLGIIANGGPVIINANVNAVAVVRDPFGLKDALGRPAHWWTIATAARKSTFNPHANAIYDGGGHCGVCGDIVLSSRGAEVALRTLTGDDKDQVIYDRTIFDRTADSFAADHLWSSAALLGLDVVEDDWIDIAVIAGRSIVGRNADIIIVTGALGLYNLHQPEARGTTGNSSTSSARQRLSATVNAPIEFGNAVLTLALEDQSGGTTADSSPYANNMTVNNSPGTVAAVFGSGYSATNGSSLSKSSDSDFTPLGAIAVSFWVKTQDLTEIGATAQYLFYLGDGTHYITIYPASSTVTLKFQGGSGNTTVVAPFGIFDQKWHHLAFHFDGGGGKLHFYIDGVEVGTPATNNWGSFSSINEIAIGDNTTPGTNFKGLIDDFMYSTNSGTSDILTAESIAKIHAEGRKALAAKVVRACDCLISNTVIDIDALDNGIWAAAFAGGVQIWDGRILLQEVTVPSGTVKTVALINNPGADSVGVAIGTTANLKFVQPDVSIQAMMAHRYKEPIYISSPVVVDSAGVGGIFWVADDAIDAGFNAGREYIFIKKGTYGPFDADQADQTIEGESWNVLIDGGTADDAIDVTATKVTIRNMTVQTTSGGGSYDGVNSTGDGRFLSLDQIRVMESGDAGMELGAPNSQVRNSLILDADASGIKFNHAGGIVENTMIQGYTDYGIFVTATGDNARITGNNIDTPQNNSIYLHADAEDNVVVGNLSDAAINDLSGTSTVTGNEQY